MEGVYSRQGFSLTPPNPILALEYPRVGSLVQFASWTMDLGSSAQPIQPDSLPILDQRRGLVAVEKPADLLTHRTRLFPEDGDAQEILSRQLGVNALPVHRLDRKTSGVLLFACSSAAAREAAECFQSDLVQKTYLAIVRGYIADSGTVDRPLKHADSGREQSAVTHFCCLGRIELPIPVGAFATARYSLVEVKPETGRRHQIRRHLRGLGYPLIGDTIYGNGDHNRFFRSHFGWSRLFLHASSLVMPWPEESGAKKDDPEGLLWRISSPLSGDFAAACVAFGWNAGTPDVPGRDRPPVT